MSEKNQQVFSAGVLAFMRIHCEVIGFTYMLQEDAELWVGLRVDGGLENWKEDVFQHLSEMWHKVPASENVTKGEIRDTLQTQPTVFNA